MPIQIPALGGTALSDLQLHGLLERLDGLFLTGSPSNVDPRHYDGPPSTEGTTHDPDRDATTLPLIRMAVRDGVPLLAICRGIQELNVALGGTCISACGKCRAAWTTAPTNRSRRSSATSRCIR